MDNDKFRRDKETTHYKYGIIPSYITIIKLINRIFLEFKEYIDMDKRFNFRNKQDKIEVCKFRNFLIDIVNEHLVTLIEGQYYDLQFLNVKLDIELLYRINSKKTAPLFSLSFILGYLMIIHYNKDFILEYKVIEYLKNLGELFGLIFQLNDDIIDRKQDSEEGKYLNLSLHLGYDESINIFNIKCEEFETKLKKIGLLNDNFKEILILLKKRLQNIK